MSKRRKRKQFRPVDASGLHPSLRKGFVQGWDEDAVKEESEALPSTGIDGVTLIKHMRGDGSVLIGRIPAPRAVATDDGKSNIIVNFGDERDFRDVSRTYTPDTVAAITSGYMCMECNEPQPIPFPLRCDLCGFEMHERQALKWAAEFDGERHLGPDKPLSEIFAEMELEREQRKFLRKLEEEGGSRMKGLGRA